MEKHPIKTSVFAGWFQQACTAFSALIVIPILLKVMPPDDVGRWFAFQGFLMATNLVDFGMGLTVSRQTAHVMGGGGKTVGTDFLNFGTGYQGVFALRTLAKKINTFLLLLALIVATLVFEGIIVHTKLVEGAQIMDLRIPWYLLALSSLLFLSASVDVAVLNGVNKSYLVRIITGLYFLFNGLAVISLAVTTKSLLMMSVAFFFVTIIYKAAFHFYVSRMFRNIGVKTATTLKTPKLSWELFKVALPLGTVNIGSYLIYSVQAPLIGSILGPSLVGPFYLAQKIILFVSQAAQQMMVPRLTQFTKLLAERSTSTAYRLADKTIFYTALASFALIFGSVLGYNLIIDFLSPHSNHLPQNVIVIMGIDYFLVGLAATAGQFVIARGKNPFVWSTLLSGLVSLVLSFFLLPQLGILGAVLSSLIASISINMWYVFMHYSKAKRSV